MRIFNPENLVKDYRELGFTEDDERKWSQMVSQPARHHPGHRPDRLRQDHHALLDAEAARRARRQRVHGGRPDRNGRAGVQPDAGAAVDRGGLRERHPHPDAPGPGHHHGRRDPRPGDRRDGDPGRADGPPRALHAAHQRRAFGDHAAARPRACRRTCCNPRYWASWRSGCCARCARTARSSTISTTPRGNTWCRPWKAPKPKGSTYVAKGCLDCRMTGYMGRVGIYETMVMTPELQEGDHAGNRPRRAAGQGLQGRHEAAADQRRDEGRGRPHLRGRGAADRAAARRRPAAASPLTAVIGEQ